MIDIQFNPNTLELSIDGHANYAESGYDIVCSACSILFFTLAESLEQSKKMLLSDPKISMENGNGKISCEVKPMYRNTVMRSYWTILNGFQIMADNYPDNVKFSFSGLENPQED